MTLTGRRQHMPQANPLEFRRDVVAVARRREAPLTQIASLPQMGSPVTVTCRVLRFMPQAHYKRRSRPLSAREWSDAHLVHAAREIHEGDPALRLPVHRRRARVRTRQPWRTREKLRLAIVTWIERTYHRRRRQRALGKLTPIEFEAVHEVAHAA
jgi:biopolymer transport protein ExbB/TolQ